MATPIIQPVEPDPGDLRNLADLVDLVDIADLADPADLGDLSRGPVLFRPDARDAGDVARLVAEKLVRRLVLDLHVEAHVPDVPALRARAVLDALSATQPGSPVCAVVGFATAVWVHSGGSPQDCIHVVIAPGSSRRRAAHLSTHEQRLLPHDVTSIAGLQLTTPNRTAADMARTLPVGKVGPALDQLARHTGLRAVEVLTQLEGMPHGRGVARARDQVNAWAAAVASR